MEDCNCRAVIPHVGRAARPEVVTMHKNSGRRRLRARRTIPAVAPLAPPGVPIGSLMRGSPRAARRPELATIRKNVVLYIGTEIANTRPTAHGCCRVDLPVQPNEVHPMVGLILIVLPILVLLALGVVLLAFFEVAFAGSRAEWRRGRAQNRLPLLSGSALRRWAASLAQQVVARYAQRPRSGDLAPALAREIEGLTSEVIEASRPQASRSPSARCSECNREEVAVTAPETIAIVDHLRQRLSGRELGEIRRRAESNARRWNAGDPQEDRTATVCPLLSERGCCISFESRPVYCRGHCVECRSDSGLDADDLSRRDSAFAAVVGDGVSEGLRRGLSSAGWDGQLYELSAALVRALDVPDAADRWAQGEAVFESCRQLQPTG